MEQLYYLLSIRNQGWLTNAGTYSSDVEQAATFGRAEAIATAKRHTDFRGLGLVPVSVDDVAEVQG